jgi:hypothetical protein
MDSSKVTGKVTLHHVQENGEWIPLCEGFNQLQYGWGEIACRMFGDGNVDYKISAMYIEFENTAGTPSIPSYTRDENTDYYENLSLSATKDFIRVPLLATPAKSLKAGYTGINYNQLTFMAQTTGTAGVHGRTFANGSNSKVYGLALVAAPVWSDRTQDIIFARKYYQLSQIKLKPATGQVGVTWVESFN